MKSDSRTESKGVFEWLAIVAGGVLILLLVPSMQWLDRGTVGNSAELDVPNPVGVGILVALVLINGLALVLARTRLFPSRFQLILYVMMTVSLPFCSTGLMNGFLGSITASAREHLDRQIPTIRRAYTFQSPDYFPKIPEEDYEEYIGLFEDSASSTDESAVRSRQWELLLPLKQFWSGAAVDPAERARFADPQWGTADRLQASYEAIPWEIWRPVLLHWGFFFACVLVAFICLGLILRRDWVERENLPFPTVQAPLALLLHGRDRDRAAAGPPVFGLFFWIGAGIGCVILLLSGLAHYRILNLPLSGAVTFQRIDFAGVFVNEPWSILRNNILFFSPLMIGIALLVQQDVLRGTLWVFLCLQALRLFAGIAEAPLSRILGPHWPGNQLPYYAELGTGAVLVFTAFLLWRSRSGSTGKGNGDGSTPRRFPLSPAGIGFVVSLTGMVFFWYMLGVTGVPGLVFILLVFVWTWIGAVGLARCRTEGGLPLSTANFVRSDMLPRAGGAGTFGVNNMIVNGQMFFLTVAAIPGLLASYLEGLFLADRLRVPARRVTTAVVTGFVVSLAVGIVSCLMLSYWLGSQNMMNAVQDRAATPITLMFVRGDVNFDTSPFEALPCFMIPAGAAVMGLLLWIRKRMPRFPVPPICFLIVCLGTIPFQRTGIGPSALDQTINFIWGPMLIAYIVKSLLLRYGGMDLYLRAQPAALGLITSHAVMIVFWNVYHAVASPAGMTIFTGVFQ